MPLPLARALPGLAAAALNITLPPATAASAAPATPAAPAISFAASAPTPPPPSDLLSCDKLKERMENIGFSGAMGSPGQGYAYLLWYLAAKAKGCAFVNANPNPYHVDPEKGQIFQLQRSALDWDTRGPKALVRRSNLVTNNINLKGNLDPSRDVYDLFRFLPAGEKLQGRDAFYLVAHSGEAAGKCMNARQMGSGLDGKPVYPIYAEPCTEYASRWTVGQARYGDALDVFTPHGQRLGVLDHVQRRYPFLSLLVSEKWTGEANQRWYFRPEKYQR